jgi:hypothetical protein
LHLEVQPVGGRGVTREPVVVVARIENLTDEPLRLLERSPRWPRVEISVWDAAGRRQSPPPRLPDEREVGGIAGVRALAPRATSRPVVQLLDRVFRFADPGTYEIRADLWDWHSIVTGVRHAPGAVPVLASASTTYVCRDGSREDYDFIAAFLAWWTAGMWRHRDQVEWPPLWRDEEVSRQAGHLVPEMLVNFADESILPYMVQCARLEMKPWAFEAIRRIGTPRARQALELLSTSGLPAVAQAARAELAKFGESSANATQGTGGKEP